MDLRRRSTGLFLGVGALTISAAWASEPATERRYDFHIEPQAMGNALSALAQQSGLSLVLPADYADDIKTAGVSGRLTQDEALRTLVGTTGVTYHWVKANTVSIVIPPPTAAQPPTTTRENPQVVVTASHNDGNDDAAFAYKFWPVRRLDPSLLALAESGTLSDSLDDMMLNGFSIERAGELGSIAGQQRQVDLWGFGPTDTVVMFGGRPMAGVWLGGSPMQAAIGLIPISAVCRVDTVAGPASSIYGGGAAGTVDFVLCKDYQGVRIEAAFDRAEGTEADATSASFSYGDTFFDGRTRVNLNVGVSKEDPLVVDDRDQLEQWRLKILENNSGYWHSRVAPPLSELPNVASVSGEDLGNGLGRYATLGPGYATSGYNFALADSAQGGGGRGAPIQSGVSGASLIARIDHQLSSIQSLYAEFLGTSSRRRIPASAAGYMGLEGAFVSADAPNNTFRQAVRVTRSIEGADGILDEEDVARRAIFGAKWALNDFLSLNAEYLVSTSSVRWTQPAARSAVEDAASGRLDVLRDPSLGPLDVSPYLYDIQTSWLPSRIESVMLQAVGKLVEGSAGHATLTVAAIRRQDTYGDALLWHENALQERTDHEWFPKQYQASWGALVQLDAQYRQLELQIAGRGERTRMSVSTPRMDGPVGIADVERLTFSSVNPMAVLRWNTPYDLALRASISRGSVLPTVTQVAPGGVYPVPPGMFTDERRGGEPVMAGAVRLGGNPALKTELADSVSFGFEYSPQWWPGARFSVDRTRIRKRGDIVSLLELDLQTVEKLGRVSRVEAAPEDLWGDGLISGIDLSDANLSRVEAVLWRAEVDGLTGVHSWGQLQWALRGTWQPLLLRQLTDDSPIINEAGVTSDSPLRFSAAGRLLWRYGHWSFGWTARHASSYEVSRDRTIVLNQGGDRVPSQLFHDVQLGWSGQALQRWPGSLDVKLAVANVLGRDAEFDAGAARTYYFSPYPDPRLRHIRLTLSVKF